MNAKNTPGPWAVDPKFRVPVVGYPLKDGGEPLPIVDVVHGYDRAQARANARLIAAAPELLEALRAIVSELEGREDVYDGADGMPRPNEAMSLLIEFGDRARAAIAKAEGAKE